MKLEYYWTDLPDGSHVAVNYAAWEGKITGSVRHWSRDTRMNVGRSFSVAPGDLTRNADGSAILRLEQVGDAALSVPIPAAIVAAAEAESAAA